VHTLREGGGRNPGKYAAAIRATIESAVVTWIGIVLCEIGMLAPTGGITVRPLVFGLREGPLKDAF
jgi:hypothetical protein